MNCINFLALRVLGSKIGRQDFSTLLVSGWGLIFFLKLNLLLDWTTTRGQGSGVQNSACSCTGTSLVASVATNDSAGSALAIYCSKTGWGDVAADSARTQIAW